MPEFSSMFPDRQKLHLSLLALWVSLVCALGVTGCSSRVAFTRGSSGVGIQPFNPSAIETGWSRIQSGKLRPAEKDAYNREARRLLSRLVGLTGSLPEKKGDRLFWNQEIEIRLDDSQVESLDRADAWLLADTIQVEQGLRDNVIIDGIGVPMIVRYQKDLVDQLIPESGLWAPVTALIIPETEQRFSIRLLDPSRKKNTSLYGCPLAANFTSPLARDFYGRQQHFPRARALINFEKFEPRLAIERVFSFAPEKQPVVLVHGIFSSSLTWRNVINELMADPEIRENYEFWTFTYPSGAPIPYLTHELRKSVEEMHQYRKSRGAGRQSVTLIGHSMGGLMSKTLTQHSGHEQWDQIFETPPSQVASQAEERDALSDMFFFEPLPYVKQVIFVSTPHHGTKTSRIPPVQLVDALIRNPENLELASEQIRLAGHRILTPLGMEIFQSDFPNSIEHMRDDSKLGRVFDEIPLNSRVSYHSLIGSKKGLEIPKEEMTDGVVEYPAAHLEGVKSEMILHSDHSVHNTRDAIAEFARILKSQLR